MHMFFSQIFSISGLISDQQSIRQRNQTDWAVASNSNFLPGKASSFSLTCIDSYWICFAMSSIPSAQGLTLFPQGPPLSPSEDEINLPNQFYWMRWALKSQGDISDSGLWKLCSTTASVVLRQRFWDREEIVKHTQFSWSEWLMWMRWQESYTSMLNTEQFWGSCAVLVRCAPP